MSDSTPNPINQPILQRNAVARALGCPTRWDILKALAAGEPMGAGELGKIAGCNVSTACKHMRILAAAGLVEQGRGRLYRIPPYCQPTPGQRVVDYGHCLLRLGLEAPVS